MLLLEFKPTDSAVWQIGGFELSRLLIFYSKYISMFVWYWLAFSVQLCLIVVVSTDGAHVAQRRFTLSMDVPSTDGVFYRVAICVTRWLYFNFAACTTVEVQATFGVVLE